MATVVVTPPPDVAEKIPMPELDDRLTVSAMVVGFPSASCSWTVMGPRVGEDDAVPDTAAVVKTSLAGVPVPMASFWVSLVSPVAAAVMVGVPALVSP